MNMKPSEAYTTILYAMNGRVNSKFAKRINKRSKKYRWFRVPEYEEFIINDIKFCYLYAKNVVHGKLPEKMHNVMIAEAMCQPENHYLKAYFQICKDNFNYPEHLIREEDQVRYYELTKNERYRFKLQPSNLVLERK